MNEATETEGRTRNLALEGAVEAFLAEHPSNSFGTAEAAYGQCDGVANHLFAYLADRGFRVEIINCSGLLVRLEDDAHPEWLDFRDRRRQRSLWHVVVRCDGWVIDLTGMQYGARFGERIFTPSDAYLREWEEVGAGPYYYREPIIETPEALLPRRRSTRLSA